MATLKAYYKFDDGDSPVIFTDSSETNNPVSNGYPGADYPSLGVDYTGNSTPKKSLAVLGDYSYGTMRIPSSSVYKPTSDYTTKIKCKVKVNSSMSTRVHLSLRDSVTGYLVIGCDLTLYNDPALQVKTDWFVNTESENVPTSTNTNAYGSVFSGWYDIEFRSAAGGSDRILSAYINDTSYSTSYTMVGGASWPSFPNNLLLAVDLYNEGQLDEVQYYILDGSDFISATVTDALSFTSFNLTSFIDTSEYFNTLTDFVYLTETVSYDPFINYIEKFINEILSIRSKIELERIRTSGPNPNTEYESVIEEFLGATDSSLAAPTLFIELKEDLLFAETITPSLLMESLLSDAVIFLSTETNPEKTYSTYSFNSRVSAISEYTNYDFNSFTVYQDRAYGAAASGFYLLEGCTDNEDPIVVRMRTAAMDFGTSNLKSIPQVYLGIDQDSSIIMKVAVDGKAESYHKLDLTTNHLGTQRIKLPKGHIGRWFQFELMSEVNTTFTLDSIEFYLMPFRRKM